MGTRVMSLPDSGEDTKSQKLKMNFLLELGYRENPDTEESIQGVSRQGKRASGEI
ncbi:hypothetical protein F3Y22_tig00112319pilonHSYRG00118 [Hibiscus syriacus]|uniref:Uncharacterized protein n=1 Tax=Hibiscus syriacus TaxID=106335 RepID=A0A6A2Y6D1_HIBSY|nr:hypothetical protein F3Y22_tig00112319pilonHSYRG00118 [Hibiscus syriacus]